MRGVSRRCWPVMPFLSTNGRERRYRALGQSCFLLAALAGAPSGAFAQPVPESPDLATAEEMDIPADLPGHERGDRVREPAKPAEPPTSEPAPTDPARSEWFGGEPLWTWSAATGDWGGARTWLTDHGIELAASYTLDWSGVWSGGVRNTASTRSLFDANATFDLATLAGLQGATLFFDYYSTDGRGGWDDSGDYHGTSNIQTGDNLDQIAELWWEQKLFEDIVRFKLGKVDANTEFAFAGDASGEFMNSGAAYSTTAFFVLPTYPDPATGAVLFVYPTKRCYLGGGFFDGSASAGKNTGRLGPHPLFHGDEFFWICEAGFTWKEFGGLGAGRLAAGAWHHTGDFARFDGGDDEDGTAGLYLVGEQQLVERQGLDEDSDPRGLFAFAQYGHADEDVSDSGNHLGAGLVVLGTCSARQDDAAGVYWSWTDLSGVEGSGYDGDESVIELFYKVQLTPWVFVRPDLQFVFNPSGNPEIDDAVVGAVRFEISF